MKLFGLISCFYLCVSFLEASEMYRAGMLHLDKEVTVNEYASFVYEAGKKNVDILVLPPSKLVENYDEAVESLSKAAKEASVYVVAHLHEKTFCQNQVEVIKSNLVFDREGSIVSVYRKPVSNVSNCSSLPSKLVAFNTDFGVTFGLLMHEDFVLQDVDYFKGLKNLVMTGPVNANTFLNGPVFLSSWSYINNAYLISSSGMFMGRNGLNTDSGILVIADLNKSGGSDISVVPNLSSERLNTEEMSQYTIKPLDLEASIKGYKERVCQEDFCCEFYVKTAVTDLMTEAVSYGLAALDAVYRFTAHSGQHSIGAQSCAVFACAGLYKRSCELGSNGTKTLFEKISLAANFTKQNAMYPIVLASSKLQTEKFKFETKSNVMSIHVTIEMVDTVNVVEFGIFGPDYLKDLEDFTVASENSDSTYHIYDYIFNEDVQDFFDYFWIRFRILLVVVSIYILEMM